MSAGMIADALDALERQALARLLTVIHLDFAAQIEQARNLGAEEMG